MLLVEDDVAIRDALQDILEGEGYDVIPANDGRQALEFLRQSRPSRPDVMILDIMLPIVDGRKVLEAMQAEADLATIPVIVVSAATREKPAGARAFMRKPIALGRLFQMVRSYADGEEPPDPDRTLH